MASGERQTMADLEKSIFESISKNYEAEFKALLSQYKGNVDFCDENGMTALQHAAYKGNTDIVQSLLDRGADVNSGKHEYDYSALHFGALSGNSEVCLQLLNAGAKPTATNSVGRTASQMAAFVGNHHIVSVINNFVPRSEIAYFSKVQGLQIEPALPVYLVDKLHHFVMEINVHPIRVALNFQKYQGFLENIPKIRNVLETLSSKEMKKASELNEVLAFKYHYLYYMANELQKIREKSHTSKDTKKEEVGDEKKHDCIEVLAKRLLKPGKDGTSLDYMEVFLKECIREYPFRDCTIFHQMVSTLTGKDPPSALSIIGSTINGQRGFVDSVPYCSTCGEEKPAKKCSKCKNVQYCDRECQRLHWFAHKKVCNRLTTTEPSPSPMNVKHVVDTAQLSEQLQNLMSG